MSPLKSELSLRTVAEHEIVAFYDIDGFNIDSGPTIAGSDATQEAIQCRDLAREWKLALPEQERKKSRDFVDLLPPDQVMALRGRHADLPVWRQAEPDSRNQTDFGVGDDLHPPLRSIMSGSRTDLATRWLLSEATQRLLQRGDIYEKDTPVSDRVQKSIAIEFSKAARQRIEAAGRSPRTLRLSIDSIELTLFKTRKGLMQVRLRFAPVEDDAPLTVIELLEANYELSRFNSFSWIQAQDANQRIAQSFTLGTLLRGLCFPASVSTRRSGRVFTHLFARLDEETSVEDADLFGLYAARHYTTDYDLIKDASGIGRVRDFRTIGHTLSLEGGATVISTPPGAQVAQFLQHFKTHTFHAHYVPILTLALHERNFLVEKTSSALLSARDHRSQERWLHSLRSLLHDSLTFRIFFRYTEVSKISMHNAFNRALRQALGLNQMQNELSADITEISAFIERREERIFEEAERERNSKFWLLGVIGGAILAALSTGSFVKAIIEGWKAWHGTQAVMTNPGDSHSALIGTAAGMLAFVLFLIAGFVKRPQKKNTDKTLEDDGLSYENGDDFIVHRSHE